MILYSEDLKIFRALMYLISQISGTGVGVLVFYYCTPFTKKTVTSNYPQADGVNYMQETMMELITSYLFFLVLFVTSFGSIQKQPSAAVEVEEEAAQTHHEMHCLLAGCTVFACSAVGSGVSGGYMNPLFALGIGIMNNDYRMLPIFIPFLSAILASITGYLFGFSSRTFSKKKPQRAGASQQQ